MMLTQTDTKPDWLFNTKSRVLQADWMIFGYAHFAQSLLLMQCYNLSYEFFGVGHCKTATGEKSKMASHIINL